MRRLIVFLIALLVAAPAFAQDAAKETAFDRITRTGVIRCGYGISPPNLVKDPNTGIVSGLDYDIWQEVGKELGLKVEFTEEAGWGNFIEGLKTGRYDAFCSMLWPDPARSRFLSLTMPVLYSFLDTYVRTDDHRFDGNLDLINKPSVTVPAIEGDVSVTMVKNHFPEASILYLPQTGTLSDMFMALLAKKADAIFIDQAMAADLTRSNPGSIRKLEGVPHSFVFASYFAVAQTEPHLRDMINVALRTIIDDGRMEQMAHRYSPDYMPPKKNY